MFWDDCVVSAVNGLLDIAYQGVHPHELFFSNALRPAASDDVYVVARRLEQWEA
jgi:hypothetical protein